MCSRLIGFHLLTIVVISICWWWPVKVENSENKVFLSLFCFTFPLNIHFDVFGSISLVWNLASMFQYVMIHKKSMLTSMWLKKKQDGKIETERGFSFIVFFCAVTNQRLWQEKTYVSCCSMCQLFEQLVSKLDSFGYDYFRFPPRNRVFLVGRCFLMNLLKTINTNLDQTTILKTSPLLAVFQYL